MPENDNVTTAVNFLSASAGLARELIDPTASFIGSAVSSGVGMLASILQSQSNSECIQKIGKGLEHVSDMGKVAFGGVSGLAEVVGKSVLNKAVHTLHSGEKPNVVAQIMESSSKKSQASEVASKAAESTVSHAPAPPSGR